MRSIIGTTLVTLALGIGLPAAAGAQQRPTLAIVPTQYFAATEQGADHVTQALSQEFARQGYRVVTMDRADVTFRAMGLSRDEDIGDQELVRFGRRLGVDLVAHPQLLSVGTPATRGSRLAWVSPPSAVLYLRVLNARTGKGLYTRQISFDFRGERPEQGRFAITPLIAAAAVDKVAQNYFERVAGTRQEYRRMPSMRSGSRSYR